MFVALLILGVAAWCGAVVYFGQREPKPVDFSGCQCEWCLKERENEEAI